jgi:hypothetical protein
MWQSPGSAFSTSSYVCDAGPFRPLSSVPIGIFFFLALSRLAALRALSLPDARMISSSALSLSLMMSTRQPRPSLTAFERCADSALATAACFFVLAIAFSLISEAAGSIRDNYFVSQKLPKTVSASSLASCVHHYQYRSEIFTKYSLEKYPWHLHPPS